MTRVIAVANQKGGVGKTTTAVSVCAVLAQAGQRCLLVDMDPQGNAVTGAGIDPRMLELSMYQVLLGQADMADCILPTAVPGFALAPARLEMSGAEIELVAVLGRELKLRQALAAVADRYDYVLIDCPPSLGLLTVNALAAAQEVLVPVQCEYYALEGLGQLLHNVELVRESLNPHLAVSAIVMVMHDARTRLSNEVVAEVRKHFGGTVCQTIVPRTVRLSEAPSVGQPVTLYAPLSTGAVAYRELAHELHARHSSSTRTDRSGQEQDR